MSRQMEFPEFKDDDEMAAWFEENDVDASSLPIASDVVVDPNVLISLVDDLYVAAGVLRVKTASRNAPSSEPTEQSRTVLVS